MEYQEVTQFNSPDFYTRLEGRLAKGRLGFAADIDGTLSPIAATPGAASITPACREALIALKQSRQVEVVALITGRSSLDAREMVGLPDLLYLGNNGLEALVPGSEVSYPVKAARPYLPLISTVLEALKNRLLRETVRTTSSATPVSVSGWQKDLIFENKGITASIHYRLCPDPELARQTILQYASEIASKAGLRVKEGRMVVELRPPVEINKGTAIMDLVDLFHLESMVFVGDDLTDVDAFHALKRLEKESRPVMRSANSSFEGIGVGVRSLEMPDQLASSADFLLDGVRGVEEFLQWFSTRANSLNFPMPDQPRIAS
ncbi:MAG TPA: trehalose-phosphatase [Chloroflexia bacterium]|nr:trehalose-phosphatase [Chloroflexia bacterium]